MFSLRGVGPGMPREFDSISSPMAGGIVENLTKLGWFLGVADTNDVIQKIEKTLNNTHTTTQKLTNNSFRNTKKHPKLVIPRVGMFDNWVVQEPGT